MKKLLLILFCLPLIGWGQGDRYTILAKYNGLEHLMASQHEMHLLLCGNCETDKHNDYKWKNISNWKKEGSKVLRLSYFEDVNFDEYEIEYYTLSEEVKKLKVGEIYWVELEFPRITMIDIFLGANLLDLEADFISAKKATDNEITEYFFEEPVEENYSDW